MCLTVDTNRHLYSEYLNPSDVYRTPKPFVATRPLVVKKIVKRVVDTGGFVSPYMGTPIKFGVLLTTELEVSSVYYTYVNQGFHAFLYNFKKSILRYRPKINNPFTTTVYGVIPVGATYYIGKDSEVVTNKITYYKSLPALRKALGIKKFAEPHVGCYNS